MKNEKILMIVFAGVLSAGVLCTEPVSDTVRVVDTLKVIDTLPPVPAANLAIGNWKLPLSLFPFIPETLNVSLIVKPDSSFKLNLTKRTSVQLYNSEGTWKATNDSIFLHSSKCLVVDTIPDPDTLMNLGDSLCSIPIRLKLPVVDSSWVIETKKLATMLSGFPIEKNLLDNLIGFVPKLYMKKTGSE